jgi:hypothetical protein
MTGTNVPRMFSPVVIAAFSQLAGTGSAAGQLRTGQVFTFGREMAVRGVVEVPPTG